LIYHFKINKVPFSKKKVQASGKKKKNQALCGFWQKDAAVN